MAFDCGRKEKERDEATQPEGLEKPGAELKLEDCAEVNRTGGQYSGATASKETLEDSKTLQHRDPAGQVEGRLERPASPMNDSSTLIDRAESVGKEQPTQPASGDDCRQIDEVAS